VRETFVASVKAMGSGAGIASRLLAWERNAGVPFRLSWIVRPTGGGMVHWKTKAR
jgi:hypothetical protein